MEQTASSSLQTSSTDISIVYSDVYYSREDLFADVIRHLSSLLGSVLRRNLSVLVESLSLRRSSDSSVGSGSNSDDSGVDGAGDTVVQLVVQLWQSVLLVHRGLRQVSNGSSLNHVSDGDSLDGLVLRNTSSTVQTSDWLDVASTLLVSTVGRSLLWHVARMLVDVLRGGGFGCDENFFTK